jgi:Bacterial archaeo-eukaryotic release factor family 11
MLHIDIPHRDQVSRLLAHRGPCSVSIYVATDPASSGDAARIEFKNLAAEAVQQLRDAGVGSSDLTALQEEIADLVDDDLFWRYQARSLAAFATPESLVTFRLPNQLSSTVEVADRFFVKPLLRSLTFPQAAMVLALAQGSVRLVEIAADAGPWEVRVDDLPTDVASAVGKSSIADRAPSGRLQGSEGQKVRIRQYARSIEQALRPILAGGDVPLIQAGTDPMESIYRSVNSYPRLVATSIPGNPEAATDAELAASARQVLDGEYASELADLLKLWELRTGQERTRADVSDVARAATFGAVDTVLVDIDPTVPGTIDEDSGAVTFAPEDPASYGVVDEIARRVWLNGGRVLAVRADEVPGDQGVAAILRYAI